MNTPPPEHYSVTIFEPGGQCVTVPCEDHEEAASIAACMMPSCGASYIHDQDRELVFKPYRPRHITSATVNTRRLSAAQIEAAAKRFDDDGEHENAQQMRGLLK